MPDWFKRIASMISTKTDQSEATAKESDSLQVQEIALGNSPPPSAHPLFTETVFRHEPALFSHRSPSPIINSVEKKSLATIASPSAPTTKMDAPKDDPAMKAKTPEDDNLKALKRLRDLPRGTQVESRIAAISNLLGESEIFKTLKILRWPQDVICPRCHSTNVVRRDPPSDAVDQRHYYECLNCKGAGTPSDFDDFTGLPIKSLNALRQWILCWYLIGFCSVTQIARVLGISVTEVIQIATLGTELTELPEAREEQALDTDQQLHTFKGKVRRDQHRRKKIQEQEELAQSESKTPHKPGYKSKK